jgi:hypothetical protein
VELVGLKQHRGLFIIEHLGVALEGVVPEGDELTLV